MAAYKVGEKTIVLTSGITPIQESIDFVHAKEQLFILTGIEPIQTYGRVNLLSHAEHLRFSFQEQGIAFYRVKTLLKLFGIAHQADLYKKVGVNEHQQAILEYYITVAKQQFVVLQRFFAVDAIPILGDLKDTRYKIHALDMPLRLAMIEILFDPQFQEDMKKRNQDKYRLEGVMYYLAKLSINSMPCFQHLQNTGMITTLSMVNPPENPTPITLMYHQQRKQPRKEAATASIVSSRVTRRPKGN